MSLLSAETRLIDRLFILHLNSGSIIFLYAGILNIEVGSNENSNCLGVSSKPCLNGEQLTEAIFVLNNTRFLDNTVGKGAPTVSIPSLSLLDVCCGDSPCIRASSMKQSTCRTDDKNKTWSNCTRFEPDFSCTPSNTMVVSLLSDEPSTSAQELEGISVDFQNSLGQAVVVQGSLFVQLANENSAQLSGQPTEGIHVTRKTVVKGLELRGEPGSYGLKFTFIPEKELKWDKLVETINVTLRDCTIGEVSKDGGRICEKCDTNSYSFDPTLSSCLQCPKSAVCNGTTLAPLDGYWHSNSQSPIIHKCLHKHSCIRTNRTADLAEKAKYAVDALSTQHSYPQCSKVRCSCFSRMNSYLAFISKSTSEE